MTTVGSDAALLGYLLSKVGPVQISNDEFDLFDSPDAPDVYFNIQKSDDGNGLVFTTGLKGAESDQS